MADKAPFLPTTDSESVGAHVLFLKVLALFSLLYLFILSISLLGASFKLFGTGLAEAIFQATSNPIVALMIGVLTTAIIQSSSTTISIIVGLVASGMLPFEAAVPMVMGANIGTSVTNIIVSMGHISRGDEFKRAFCGSLLHDFFNICAVAVVLPLEISFGLISKSALKLESLFSGFGGMKFGSPLMAITKPVANSIINLSGDSGWISAMVALAILFIALHFIVKVLRSMVLSRVEKFFQRYIFRTPILSFILGAVLTAFVQSSSITTSLVVPLLGAGVLRPEQIYPYLLGANVGTTITAFLASFVTGSHQAISVAFAHFLFNIYGIGIFWPLRAIPLWLSHQMAELTTRSKLIPILYIVIVFFIIPGLTLLIMD